MHILKCSRVAEDLIIIIDFFMKTYHVRLKKYICMVIILVIGILSGSFLAPNHDSNLHIVYPFLMDLLIGEYFPRRPMNWLLTYVAGLESESNKNINIFTRKLPAIHFAFVLFTPIKCRACTVPEVQVLFNFSCFL